jgi:hypothetical protein
MRTFSWKGGELERGIAVKRSSQKNYYTPLGDSDTPGPHHMVTLHRDNPAEIRDGRVFDVFPYWVRPRAGDAFLVLAQPHAQHQDTLDVLVRISTWAPEAYSGRGFWRQTVGETDTLVTGVGHYRDSSGRKAVASEGLVRLEAGKTLRVRPEGSDDHWAVTNDGEWVVSELWEVYVMRKAKDGQLPWNAFALGDQ